MVPTMVIAPDLSAAWSIQSAPGVYALLLGSGVSRSAGIPTGWDVVLDLVRRLADVSGETPEDLEQWYESEFGEPPEYSTLLERIARRPAERGQLLRHYVEPTDEDREAGLKVPSAAHRAIATLVRSGHVRVIVTTNFDRLIETALDEAGVAPLVISTPDQAEGATPLAHSRCTVVKVHGDYLDARTKNSVSELESYDPRMDRLLDQIFDEYGLVVCGWSGEWDAALRAAMERAPNRRYTTYWCARGEPEEQAARLITHREALVTQIADADSFFDQLGERVASLEASLTSAPASAQVAVAELKRYLTSPEHRIRYAELMRNEVERVVSVLGPEVLPADDRTTDPAAVAAMVRRLDGWTDQFLSVLANASYWGTGEHREGWLASLRRLAQIQPPTSGRTDVIGLYRYPALLGLYTAGIAVLARAKHEDIATIFLAPAKSVDNEDAPFITSIFPHDILHEHVAHALLDPPPLNQKWRTPISRYLDQRIRAIFNDLLPSDDEFTSLFDRYEYYASLVHADLHQREYGGTGMAGGSYEWRRKPQRIEAVVDREIKQEGERWPLLQSGLFDGSALRLLEVKKLVDEASARRS